MLSKHDLGLLEDVPFASLQLDPNNPRIAPKPAPGYQDAGKLFDPAIQKELTAKVYEAYSAEDLEKTITSLGWAPVDPIIAWRHPARPDLALVVEGNTRTSILRRARTRLADAQERLNKAIAGGRTREDLLSEMRAEVASLEELVRDTESVRVQFVQAATVEELQEKLPRLLGVRHVSGSKNWGPYATNVYISALYADLYQKENPAKPFKLDEALIAQAAQVFSLRPPKAWRMIQAASAFDHFKLEYEEKVAKAGNKLTDEDQYFFDQILQSKHARTEFEFEKADLKLSEQASEALFQWAFSKPRPTKSSQKNENVFRKAEDITRIWEKIAKYDAENGTTFAERLDVEDPVDAPTLAELEFKRSQHEQQMSPLTTLSELVEAFEKLPATNLASQAEMIEPMLLQVREKANKFLGMIKGAEGQPQAAEMAGT